ncbi:histidine phosphatase family protein [Acetomicrobium hydrogeniformans]|nr:histidine phosphatase family protein [Acetomicrobium hydrogeniformans]
MLRYYLMRHGETTWNAKDVFQGKQDTPLSEKGLLQAKLTASLASRIGKARIWCSPLKRALQTAELLAERGGYEILTEKGLMEIDHGKWERLHVEEVKRLYPESFEMWHKEPDKVVMPDGESLRDVQERALRVLTKIRESGEEQAIIMTHDAVIKCLLCHWLELPLSKYWSFKFSNCSVSIVEEDDKGKAVILLLDDVCHLEQGWTWPEQKSV